MYIRVIKWDGLSNKIDEKKLLEELMKSFAEKKLCTNFKLKKTEEHIKGGFSIFVDYGSDNMEEFLNYLYENDFRPCF